MCSAHPSAIRYSRTTALTKGCKHVYDAGGTHGFKAPEELNFRVRSAFQRSGSTFGLLAPFSLLF